MTNGEALKRERRKILLDTLDDFGNSLAIARAPMREDICAALEEIAMNQSDPRSVKELEQFLRDLWSALTNMWEQGA